MRNGTVCPVTQSHSYAKLNFAPAGYTITALLNSIRFYKTKLLL